VLRQVGRRFCGVEIDIHGQDLRICIKYALLYAPSVNANESEISDARKVPVDFIVGRLQRTAAAEPAAACRAPETGARSKRRGTRSSAANRSRPFKRMTRHRSWRVVTAWRTQNYFACEYSRGATSMFTELGAAQFAGNACAASRTVTSPENETIIPNGWTVAFGADARGTGFLAGAIAAAFRIGAGQCTHPDRKDHRHPSGPRSAGANDSNLGTCRSRIRPSFANATDRLPGEYNVPRRGAIAG